MNKEIERKYLLSGLPAGLKDGQKIYQGYLSIGDPEVRVRRKDKKYYLTMKTGEGLVRIENEKEISQEIFEMLWPATTGKQIRKTRYNIFMENGTCWEIDEYHGSLTHLFTAEIELVNEDEQIVFPDEIKPYLIADVTMDKQYKNKNLAS